jgi:hypothetical protein
MTSAPSPVVGIDGDGAKVVRLPRSVALPAIVHASYTGTGNFIVKSRTARGLDTAVLANARGAYEGTFPVPLGFVDPKGMPTAALDVAADGPWHLDVAPANFAPALTTGFRGNGDAVLAYRGPAASFHVTYSGASSFLLRTYGRTDSVFAQVSGGSDDIVKLPAGPLFVAVTTVGGWTIAPA